MTLYFQLLVVVFGVLIYFLYVEELLAEYIILNLKWLYVKIAGFWWLICNHPKNPIQRLRMEIQYYFFMRSLIKNTKHKSEDDSQ